MQLRESGENYLETILLLERRQGFVRSIDIAVELDYSRPSVSRAIGLLKDGGFVNVDERGLITLTEAGKIRAEEIYERHLIISAWLTSIGVDEKIALEDACRIEHVISKETFIQLKEHISKTGRTDGV